MVATNAVVGCRAAALGLGRGVRLPDAPRDHDVLPDARRAHAPLQAAAQPQLRDAVPDRPRSIRLAHLPGYISAH